jgi:transcriptional regulator with XRE-family HTH domain
MPRKSLIPQLLFGNLIRKHRIKSGLTQKEFAKALNINRAYLGSIERGEINIGLDQISHILRNLNLGFEELNIVIKKQKITTPKN